MTKDFDGQILRVGIDAGSKTLKAVVLDAKNNAVYTTYRRHGSKIIETFREVIHDICWHLGDQRCNLAITGSAGIAVADALGVPFIQEVIATTRAVKTDMPEANAVVELGGEDAKIIYLDDPVEMRMNATCAGGTGGFIDTIAFMLDVRPSRMSSLALGYRRIYPIASRCAVFAQTDVRPLLNSGASKADIAASAFEALVRQTIAGLACGRPLTGKVVFLGGPIEHMPYLLYAYRSHLALKPYDAIKPKDAHLFTCKGAALVAGEHSRTRLQAIACEGAESSGSVDVDNTVESSPTFTTLSLIEDNLRQIGDIENDLPRLPALFENDEEREEFYRGRDCQDYEQIPVYDAKGPMFLGIDAGSTTLKVALTDWLGRLVYTAYEPARGSLIDTLRDILLDMYTALPKPYSARHNLSTLNPGHDPKYPWIAGSCVTGYGEAMLRALFGIDFGVVETAAHLSAATKLDPKVTFVLDIGGQDMKALWVRDGHIEDAVLNEACSSGCGSFLEGSAYSLKSRPQAFSAAALNAKSPVDLGTKCTVFMTSRVRHAQKVGAGLGDIAAGISYSIANNALYKIIGQDKVATIGDRPVVSGGTFKSDAVLRAFERTLGRRVRRSKHSHLMGAIGASYIAAKKQGVCISTPKNNNGEGGGDAQTCVKGKHEKSENLPLRNSTAAASCKTSALLSPRELAQLKFKQTDTSCKKCENACKLTIVKVKDGASFTAGNKCPKGDVRSIKHTAANDVLDTFARTSRVPNAYASERRYMDHLTNVLSATPPAGGLSKKVAVGLANTLEMYEYMPFWATLLHMCGAQVVLPPAQIEAKQPACAWASVPSESVCYAAKLTHARHFYLTNECSVDAVLMPVFDRNSHCPVSAGYAHALADNIAPSEKSHLLVPHLCGYKPVQIASDKKSANAIYDSLIGILPNLTHDAFDAALNSALSAQTDFQAFMASSNEEVLAWAAADPTRKCVLLAGRSYHADPALMHGIDDELASLGVGVLAMAGLGPLFDTAWARARIKGAQKPKWRQSKRFAKATYFALENPQVEVIFLQSFGCGFDSVAIDESKGILRAGGKFATTLKIDDITDLAHIKIRLRTIFDAVA